MAGFVIKYYLLILIIASILTAIAFPRASKFFANINTDLTQLIPKDYQSVKSINEIREKFKSIKNLIIVVEDNNPERAKDFMAKLGANLEQNPRVGEVEYKKRGYNFFEDHVLMFLDLEDLNTIHERIDRRIQHEKLRDLYIDFEDDGGSKEEEFKFGDLEDKYKGKYSSGSTSEYYVNDEETLYTMYIYPDKDPEGIKKSEEFYKAIKDDVSDFLKKNDFPQTKVYFTGTIRTHVDEYSTLINDLKRAGLISGLGIFLILILYFRRTLAVALLFLPLTMAILFTFAISSLFIDSLNLVTSFLFAILGGLGIEIGIHMLARYIEERRRCDELGYDKKKAMKESLYAVIYHTGGSALTSAASVAATFFILTINDFKGFSEFGFIAGVGLTLNYLCFQLVFPAMLVLAEKLHVLKFKRKVGFELDADAKDIKTSGRFPLPRFILAGLALFTIISLIDIPHLKFEWRFSKIKANLATSEEAKSKQRETSKSVNSPALVVLNSKEDALAVKSVIENVIKKKPDSVVDTFKSYYDIVPDDQDKKMGVIGDIKALLEDDSLKLVKGEHKEDIDKFKDVLNKMKPVEERDVPPKIHEIFWGNVEGNNTQVGYINPLPHLELDDGRNAIKFAEQVAKIETPNGTFYSSSNAIVFADVLRTMISNSKRVVILAFLVVFLIVYIDFRRFSTAALVISPILLGVVFMGGFMYILNLKLNFYNMVVAPTVVGTSIDNSVHLYHRYKELGKGSLIHALRSSGGAALMSSMTNILGFLGLIFATHNGLRSIGDLAVTGMVACLITTLVFFPAVLQVMEDRKNQA